MAESRSRDGPKPADSAPPRTQVGSGHPDRHAGRPRHPDPPTVFAAALGAMVALALVIPGTRIVSGAWRAAGLLPVACGVALHRAAWRRLRSAGTPVRADEEPRKLVTDGPYARSRNPMYLAGALILLGSAPLLGAATPFLVVPAYVWLADRRFLPAEERTLEARFGEAYRSYRERVPRWV